MAHLLINLSFLLPNPTGISTYAANIFPYLKSLHPTLLVARENRDFNCYSVPPNLAPDSGTKGHLLRLLWTQFQLPQIYQTLKASLLFSPVPEAPLSSHCRSAVMVHDLIPLRFPKRYSPLTPYFRHYIPQVLRRATHVLCNSNATARDIADYYGVSAAKITPIPLAYDASHFRPIAGEGGTSSSCPYFLYLGRHDPHKNLHRLIEAFGRLPDGQDCQLWLAGPSDRRYTPRLQGQVAEMGLSGRVRFLNYVPYEALPLLLNRALALVFPSLWEGFGFPVLEAMGCGTPVVTSNLSSLPEVAGSAAWLVDPYQVEEMAAALQALAGDGGLRSRLSSLGLERARQFSWAKTGAATREVLAQYL